MGAKLGWIAGVLFLIAAGVLYGIIFHHYPGQKKTGKDGLKYVWIPPGRFRMGCSPADADCHVDENPAHLVIISRGFWMGQTEVTQAAYQRVTGKNPSEFKGPKRPVDTVTWHDAVSYCQSVRLRLPAEAEWEYAARAGSAGSRYGDLDVIAWHNGNSGKETHEVGGKSANAWGLYDMIGNVYEWVDDGPGPYTTDAATDPHGPADPFFRVQRGGAWSSAGEFTRASYRAFDRPQSTDHTVGFRCAGN